VSLSQDPTFSLLKDQFVCGYKDIENARYAGASGKHMPDGNAVDTTNGAGPHNIQMFILASDGTVLTCLPGYWNSRDLAGELDLASRLNDVWHDETLTRDEKDAAFRQMQLAHISAHSPAMVRRSRMQGFDVDYEAKHRLRTSDVFINARLVPPDGMAVPPRAVKTTDVIMHQRMSMRPFEPYKQFDVAAYSDYGKPMYDKHEDQRLPDGEMDKTRLAKEKKIGNTPEAHPIEQETKRVARAGFGTALRMGIRAALRF